jgi:hypothetical protein
MTSVRHCLLGSLIAGLLASQAAIAGPGYTVTGFVTTPANASKLQAAWDKLSTAAIMKDRTSRGLLMVNAYDGDNPATHSLVVLFPSLASAEAFRAKLFADPAWAEWQNSLSGLGTLGATIRYQTLRSWGDFSDADVVWENFAFRVKDVPAFIAANERFMASAPGKAFPGQVHAVAVAAGGMSPVSHQLNVGWASDAELEAWSDKYGAAPENLAYLADLERCSEFLGNSISRTLSASGATLRSTIGR